jgi:hypothetical protein
MRRRRRSPRLGAACVLLVLLFIFAQPPPAAAANNDAEFVETLLPAHCYNRVQDAARGEEGKDCGPVCGNVCRDRHLIFCNAVPGTDKAVITVQGRASAPVAYTQCTKLRRLTPYRGPMQVIISRQVPAPALSETMVNTTMFLVHGQAEQNIVFSTFDHAAQKWSWMAPRNNNGNLEKGYSRLFFVNTSVDRNTTAFFQNIPLLRGLELPRANWTQIGSGPYGQGKGFSIDVLSDSFVPRFYRFEDGGNRNTSLARAFADHSLLVDRSIIMFLAGMPLEFARQTTRADKWWNFRLNLVSSAKRRNRTEVARVALWRIVRLHHV